MLTTYEVAYKYAPGPGNLYTYTLQAANLSAARAQAAAFVAEQTYGHGVVVNVLPVD